MGHKSMLNSWYLRWRSWASAVCQARMNNLTRYVPNRWGSEMCPEESWFEKIHRYAIIIYVCLQQKLGWTNRNYSKQRVGEHSVKTILCTSLPCSLGVLFLRSLRMVSAHGCVSMSVPFVFCWKNFGFDTGRCRYGFNKHSQATNWTLYHQRIS